MPHLALRNRTLRFDRAGAGPALVFQHGLGSTREQALGLVGGLPGLSVAGLDAPSHGESDDAPELHSFDAMADAVVALLDHLGVERAVLGGISMGAGISLNVAIRHPERVKALVLARPAWIDKPNPENLAIIARLGGWIAGEGRDAARQRLLADAEFVAMRERIPLSAASVLAALDQPGPQSRGGVLADIVADAPTRDARALSGVACPTLVLACEQDPLHPVEIASRIAAMIPGATSEITPPRYVDPARHAAAVRESVLGFVRSLDPAGGAPAVSS